jgi:hypothetical protein
MLRFLGSESEPALPAVRWSHPHEEQLERFLRGELSLPEVLPIVRHLLKGCPQCLKVTRPIGELMAQKPNRPGDRP